MVYYRAWDAFAKAAEEVFEGSPNKVPEAGLPTIPKAKSLICPALIEQTRYCVRWRHDQGLLVLKVTDDVRVRWGSL